MDQFAFLRDLLVVYAIAGAVVFLLQWLRIPVVVGVRCRPSQDVR